MMPRSADHKLHSGQHYQHHHTGNNADGYFDEANKKLTDHVGQFLASRYPGHPWGVLSVVESGVFYIQIKPWVKQGHMIHLSSIKGDPSMRAVRLAAGEMLERLGLPRGDFSLDKWLDARTKIPANKNKLVI